MAFYIQISDHYNPSFLWGKLTDLFWDILCTEKLYKQITCYCHMAPYFFLKFCDWNPHSFSIQPWDVHQMTFFMKCAFFQSQRTGRSRERQIKAVSWPPTLSSVSAQKCSFVSKSGSFQSLPIHILLVRTKINGKFNFLMKKLPFFSRGNKTKEFSKAIERQINPLSYTSSSASLFCFFSPFFLLLRS